MPVSVVSPRQVEAERRRQRAQRRRQDQPHATSSSSPGSWRRWSPPGLTLIRALAILAEQTESKPLAAVITEMRGDIERGLSFSQAISKHPKVFPTVYIAMVRSGEVGGMLDVVLLRLADDAREAARAARRVKSAMSYPIAVGCIIVVIVSAMLLFIVPMFESMYNDLGGTLAAADPHADRGISSFLTHATGG